MEAQRRTVCNESGQHDAKADTGYCRRHGVRPELSTGGGTSDARFISSISRETVEFGPINATIHSVNECAGIDELEALAEIYYRTAKAYLENF